MEPVVATLLRLAVVIYHNSNVIDGAQGAIKGFQRLQQGTDRLALFHGTGIVHHEDHIQTDLFAGRQRLDIDDLGASICPISALDSIFYPRMINPMPVVNPRHHWVARLDLNPMGLFRDGNHDSEALRKLLRQAMCQSDKHIPNLSDFHKKRVL